MIIEGLCCNTCSMLEKCLFFKPGDMEPIGWNPAVDFCRLYKPIEGYKTLRERLDVNKSQPDSKPQSKPTGNGKTVVLEVLEDLIDRANDGEKKYGTMLKTNNGRDALVDAYQEALDMAMYLKQAIMEGRNANARYIDQLEKAVCAIMASGANLPEGTTLKYLNDLYKTITERQKCI